MKQPARTVHFDRVQPRSRPTVSRRRFLAGAGAAAAAGVLGSQLRASPSSAATMTTAEKESLTRAALKALGRSQLRPPGSLPSPNRAAGTDMLPEIDHIVVLMMENHSYDNLFGMLGRGHGQKPRGDGFTMGRDGRPTATNPYADGRIQHAFEMPTTCQLSKEPSQEWEASHVQYAGGRLDGFVQSTSGPVSMGYWTGTSLPFTYALADRFPIGDRFFCSLLGQTDPNRRFLIAATSSGMTDDVGTSAGDVIPDVLLAEPANGTIFDTLQTHGISWKDYCASYPLGTTAELYPIDDAVVNTNKGTIDQFFSDAAAGTLPSFCIVDPDYSTQSQENPQNIVVGEEFLAQVVHGIGASPAWRKTLLLINYDEHGGYYDHVVPPVALAPDSVPPVVQPGESTYDEFRRYGFRVPSLVVSPYAKPGHVSHVLYDHTSILATVERKWNLPALTYRDANANDMMDFIDTEAMAKRSPTFPELPKLPASGLTKETLACSTTGAGLIPPPDSISA